MRRIILSATVLGLLSCGDNAKPAGADETQAACTSRATKDYTIAYTEAPGGTCGPMAPATAHYDTDSTDCRTYSAGPTYDSVIDWAADGSGGMGTLKVYAGCASTYTLTITVVLAAPVFTRDDHAITCTDWPPCPDGVVSSADHSLLRVFPDACRATTGAKVTCGACVDTRTAACEPFVGRCRAPNWPTAAPDYCAGQLAPVQPTADAYTICTGAAQASDNAALVCAD